MIILDTHIWIWLVTGEARLLQDYLDYIHEQEAEGLGISVISC